MQSSLQELQQTHDGLLDWWNMNRHRTAVWRDAVEQSLHSLGRSITAGDADAANARVSEEMMMAKNIKDMENQAEETMVQTGQEEARQYTDLAGSFEHSVGDFKKEADRSRSAEEEAEKRATAALDEKDRTARNEM